MKNIEYLRLLSKEFPNSRKAAAEIINLRAICALPKGTEYFFSDIHGEYEAFSHLLRSSSGIIRAKIEETFGNQMTEAEQLQLANLIYYPREVIDEIRHDETYTQKDLQEHQKITINRLISICRVVSSKYTRSKVRKKMPADYAYAIDELLHLDMNDFNKKLYYSEIINGIIEIDFADEFIIALCELIQNLTIDSLHIIGDIFDRGARPDLVMEELMNFHDVDIQWGNHDIDWMGAACGNTACIANVLRIGTSYNTFDALEDGYGINLRPLSMFAAEVYGDDPCECFKTHILDENKYDAVNPKLAAKMCKAISIIQLKLEGQLIEKHPEYGLEFRLLLDKIDYDKGEVTIEEKTYKLNDTNFPTIDPKDPYKLTEAEETLIRTLRFSFMHSQLLIKHVQFLYSHGGMYRIVNENLLYHGCIPMDESGNFVPMTTSDGSFMGKELMDYINKKAHDAFFLDSRDYPKEKQDAVDLMWYLWCGPYSPLFGKDKITTFERMFLKQEKELTKENFNPYYKFSGMEPYADKILKEFGLDPEWAHIINGHVPVKTAKGESPVKAGGKLYIIDGGISKAYHEQTGIAGYTLIFNSHHLALAQHKPFVKGKENTPTIQITEKTKKRILVQDTDIGKGLQKQIDDLKDLLKAFESGLIREKN
ncbi:fructose-bisphosphatase class III [Butyrivibrio sp. NC2007]|uniref:fructose-bisphosphatase class III n=1 Tax=Butyrivibrio sp. NC2007 TaxID=1280683 RepID=UPI0003B60163|nr:fructose-bisphosphatase class III [Butyrivibrio sp. NC2007]